MNWGSVAFSEVAEVVTGSTPPKNDPENYGPGIPWAKPPDLDSFDPIKTTEETLSEKGQKCSRLLPEGSVLVCCIGSIGRVGIAGATLATNQQINSLVFGPYVNPRFGFYYCRYISKQFKSEARNAVVPILNKSNFSKIRIPLPPLSEQRRIVEILDQADALRQQRRAAEEKAQRILPALFYKIFGDPVANPKGWPAEALGNLLAAIRNGTTTEQNTERRGLPVTRIETISNGIIDSKRVRYVELDDFQASKWRMESGDILFSHINSESHIGKTAIYQGQPYPLIHGMNLLLLRANPEKLRPEYLFAVLNCDSVRATFRQRCKRAVNQASLNQKEITSLDIAVPPLAQQDRFCSLASNALKANESRKRVSVSTESLFANLLHRAFTGELTAKWREANKERLEAEQREQMAALEREKSKAPKKRGRKRKAVGT